MWPFSKKEVPELKLPPRTVPPPFLVDLGEFITIIQPSREYGVSDRRRSLRFSIQETRELVITLQATLERYGKA